LSGEPSSVDVPDDGADDTVNGVVVVVLLVDDKTRALDNTCAPPSTPTLAATVDTVDTTAGTDDRVLVSLID
jgi:hypothetical protein